MSLSLNEFSSLIQDGDKAYSKEVLDALGAEDCYRKEAVFIIDGLVAELKKVHFELIVEKRASEICVAAVRDGLNVQR